MRNRFPHHGVPVVVLMALLFTACSIAGPASPQTALDPDLVERGATLYATYCAACHGRRGEGQPHWKIPNPDGTYPAPPHDGSGHTWHHGDGTLFRIVRDGGASLNLPGFKSNMPAFGQTLSDDEIIAVLTYIKSLWPAHAQRFQAEAGQRDSFPR